jgi:3-hydroxyacyl-CoA dehydrogenase
MNPTVVRADQIDGIAVLTVDNPPVNTLSIAVREALHARLDELAAGPQLRAVVLMCAGKTFFSGASTDVVSHEVGHGLLDSIRPELWDAPFLEAGAFHGTVFGGVSIALACYRIASPGTLRVARAHARDHSRRGRHAAHARLMAREDARARIVRSRSTRTAVKLGFVDAVVEGDCVPRSSTRRRSVRRGPATHSDRAVDPATATPATSSVSGLKRHVSIPTGRRRTRRSRRSPPRHASARRGTRVRDEARQRGEGDGRSQGADTCFSPSARRGVPDCRRYAGAARVPAPSSVPDHGGGIAICFANAGLPVTVLDVSREALERGSRSSTAR